MFRISQVTFCLLILCEALAAPHVPNSEGNRKMEMMRVTVRFSSGGVRSIPLEQYVAAVLAGESRNFRSTEALKAMAVAVRSYALHFRNRHRAAGFDFCDTTHCQYLQFDKVTPRLTAAATASESEMVWHDGSPAATYYHANCGGSTEASQDVWGSPEPYLMQRLDRFCRRGPRDVWQSRYSKDLVRRAMVTHGVDAPDSLESLEVVKRTPSGRAATLLLIGSDIISVPVSAFRIAMQKMLGWRSVPSASFDVKVEPGWFVFSGRGAGHAVGLCQAGAERMGLAGKTYQEILAFYYPQTIIGR
jgi:stage II sporulation protein D